MRLIDADEVENYILTEGFYCGTQADKEYTAELFTKLFKTVKAIPVEWIKKWAKDNSNGEWSTEYRTIFNGLLKDWEKENE